jgi:hypothetical protein
LGGSPRLHARDRRVVEAMPSTLGVRFGVVVARGCTGGAVPPNVSGSKIRTVPQQRRPATEGLAPAATTVGPFIRIRRTPGSVRVPVPQVDQYVIVIAGSVSVIAGSGTSPKPVMVALAVVNFSVAASSMITLVAVFNVAVCDETVPVKLTVNGIVADGNPVHVRVALPPAAVAVGIVTATFGTLMVEAAPTVNAGIVTVAPLSWIGSVVRLAVQGPTVLVTLWEGTVKGIVKVPPGYEPGARLDREVHAAPTSVIIATTPTIPARTRE